MTKLFAALLALVALLVCNACSDDGGSPNINLNTGGLSELDVLAQITGDTLGVDTVRVTLTRQRPTPATINATLSRNGNVWSTTIGRVPTGTVAAGTAWKIVGEAFRSSNPGEILFRGEVENLEVSAQTAAFVGLVLAQLQRPAPFVANTPPVIDGVFVSSLAVRPTDTVTLAARAHDLDGADTLTFAWTGATGFSAPGSATTTWKPPAVGSFTLSLVVTDSRGATDGISVTITVANDPTPVGAASVIASFNRWPTVEQMTASKTLLAPGGDNVDLTAVLADLDGDALTPAWTSTCGATFTAPGATATRATTPVQPAGSTCTYTVTVTDARAGRTTGSVTLHFGNPPPITDL